MRKLRFQPRWRVQAFLSDWVTQSGERPYVPTFHRFQRQADRQVRRLRESFAPGMVRIEKVRVHGQDG